jgi:hypothetical protein
MTLPLQPATGLLLLLLLLVPGCGSDELASPTAKRLTGLAKLYLDCAVAKNGKGPANEQEFKKHIRSLPSFVVEMNEVDPNAIDTVFVSERDKEPFVVRYGISISGISGTSAPLVAHEKTGKNGKRLVVYANAKVEQLNDAQFQDLTSAKP